MYIRWRLSCSRIAMVVVADLSRGELVAPTVTHKVEEVELEEDIGIVMLMVKMGLVLVG